MSAKHVCLRGSLAGALLLTPVLGLSQTAATTPRSAAAYELEEITIVGDADAARRATGAAQSITTPELERFQYSDIQRMIRQIPGVAVQLEDGYGLRPNLSIRGTASDRSSRITLLEDNVLIAPAPYSAPAAYYFPTAARMGRIEVLKGPAAITQGPYTIGGAINLVSTPIPDELGGEAMLDVGQHATQRLHGHYGDSGDRFGWLAETHLWDSDGYQDIDLVGGDTGLDKQDWMLKFRVNSDAGAAVHQQLDFKFQFADETSEQSYLGLADADFVANPYRRYAVSQLDTMRTDHDQIIVRYLAEFGSGVSFTATGYSNDHARAWFKTEGLDVDGSASAADFSGTSWLNVIQAVNRGEPIGALASADLQAILDGGDTPAGAVQVRNNAREYYSRGLQLGLGLDLQRGRARHDVELGIRFHEDEEDRLQRNSTYHAADGRLVLDDLGLQGNADNSVAQAGAHAFHVYDRIEFDRWVLTPGVRYEDMDLERTRWETRPGETADPSSRADANLRDARENRVSVWIPGFGALYAVNDNLSLFGGIHKGFTAPGNAPDVNEEESANYEVGIRASRNRLYTDVTAFVTDYDNLLGICTASSGGNCDIGDAFNGDAATIAGLEVLLNYDFSPSSSFSLPFTASYTYMDAEFDSDIADTEFFGEVAAGDPIPYVPENELFVSIGLEIDRWSVYLSANYIDDVCVRASCGPFEVTDEALFVDLAGHWALSDRMSLFTKIENLTDEDSILGRHPYGARPHKDRTGSVGVRLRL
jgi:Fe(3+) dicitrate transport protein